MTAGRPSAAPAVCRPAGLPRLPGMDGAQPTSFPPREGIAPDARDPVGRSRPAHGRPVRTGATREASVRFGRPCGR